MTYEEITKRAKEMTTEELEKCLFYVNMVDRWTYEDRIMNMVYTEELRERKMKK